MQIFPQQVSLPQQEYQGTLRTFPRALRLLSSGQDGSLNLTVILKIPYTLLNYILISPNSCLPFSWLPASILHTTVSSRFLRKGTLEGSKPLEIFHVWKNKCICIYIYPSLYWQLVGYSLKLYSPRFLKKFFIVVRALNMRLAFFTEFKIYNSVLLPRGTMLYSRSLTHLA